MSSKNTMNRLQTITALAEAATKGPWAICLGSGNHVCTAVYAGPFASKIDESAVPGDGLANDENMDLNVYDEAQDKPTLIADFLPDWAIKAEEKGTWQRRPDHRPDMDFCAAARVDVPWMVNLLCKSARLLEEAHARCPGSPDGLRWAQEAQELLDEIDNASVPRTHLAGVGRIAEAACAESWEEP